MRQVIKALYSGRLREPSVKKGGSLWRYGVLGVPLGFLGLPLYMHLPHYYAQTFGMSLQALGMVLMISRFIDCALDPWIGRWLDSGAAALRPVMVLAALVVAFGVLLLFTLPQWMDPMPPLLLVGALLVATYVAYSVLSIRFYASGVALAVNPRDSVRVSSWREAMLVVGTILAAAAPGLGLPYDWLACIFILLLAVTLWLGRIFLGHYTPAAPTTVGAVKVLATHARIYIVLFLNALAPAVTATLYLFYMEEVLVAAPYASGCLLAYFAAAITAMPLWGALARRVGETTCLIGSFSLALASFFATMGLGVGDAHLFLMISVLTGVAFGADAVLLPSLLSQSLRRSRMPEHAAFGIWMALGKLTLALAAGFALTAIDLLQGIHIARVDAIRYCYSLLPCAIKAMALVSLFLYRKHQRSIS